MTAKKAKNDFVCKSCLVELPQAKLDKERPHLCPVCKGPNVEKKEE